MVNANDPLVAAVYAAGPAICEPGGQGMFLPVAGEAEQEWPGALRAVLYGLGMIYFFMGVAIIADSFVAAIEVITARKGQHRTHAGKTVTSKVWNDTVATLSLLALGSSAPEIALSVVDLFKKEFHFTPLGAQTIAGSAAFNLLVIVGVCIVVIPSTEIRLIQELPAFYVTAAVSVFAYFWLALILIIISPDVVEIWEAAATLLFLPMLIWVSYKVDVGDASRFLSRIMCREHPEEPDPEAIHPLLGFESDEVVVEMGPEEARTVEVVVKRPEKAQGFVSVNYRTERLRAVPEIDYMQVEGTLEFAEDVAEHIIKLSIFPKAPNRVERKFLLILDDIVGNAEFDADTDGGQDAAVMTISIKSTSMEGSALVRWFDSVVNFNGLRGGTMDWKDQIGSAVYCLGSPEDQAEASKLDWAIHLISLPWKLAFSLVPPTSYWGGWLSFYISLAIIGVLTIVISDLAELFGCVLSVRDDITAIVFVALGTSMPDLFASLSAAKEEPTADASIVNVTGSNSVNVFLGLGLPWTIGSIYWTMQGQTPDWRARYPEHAARLGADGGGAFIVQSLNLGFCVLVFGAACSVALLILHLRRKFLGAELGGPFVPKVTSFAVFMLYWFGFIGVASWRIDRGSSSSMTEMAAVLGGTGVFELAATVVAVMSIIAYRGVRTGDDDTGSQEASGGTMKRSQSGQSIGSKSGQSNASDSQKSIKRSQSGQSIGSNGSKTSKGSKSNKVLAKKTSSSTLSEGILAVNGANGIGLRVLKPRFASKYGARENYI